MTYKYIPVSVYESIKAQSISPAVGEVLNVHSRVSVMETCLIIPMSACHLRLYKVLL